jgi:hypothetical protein
MNLHPHENFKSHILVIFTETVKLWWGLSPYEPAAGQNPYNSKD